MAKNESEEIIFQEYLFLLFFSWIYFTMIFRVVQDKAWEYQSERVEVPVHVIRSERDQQDLRGTMINYYLVVEAKGKYEGRYMARSVRDYLYTLDDEIMIIWINQEIADKLPESKYKDMEKHGYWADMKKRGVWKAQIKGVETRFLRIPEKRFDHLMFLLIYVGAIPDYIKLWWRILKKIKHLIGSQASN